MKATKVIDNGYSKEARAKDIARLLTEADGFVVTITLRKDVGEKMEYQHLVNYFNFQPVDMLKHHIPHSRINIIRELEGNSAKAEVE